MSPVGIQELAAKAQQKRDDIARAAEARTKSLIAKHQQKEAEQKVKEAARQEKLKEIAKERKVCDRPGADCVCMRSVQGERLVPSDASMPEQGAAGLHCFVQ